MKRRKLTAALCLMAMVLSGCNQQVEETVVTDTSIEVETMAPVLGNISLTNEFVGSISPEEQVTVVPMVSGEITELNFEEGDEVSAGQVMFRIDDSAARLQLESAELSLAGIEQSEQSTLGASQKLNNLQIQSSIDSINAQIAAYEKQFSDADKAQGGAEAQMGGYEANIKDIEKQIDRLNETYEFAKNYTTSLSRNAVGKYEFIDKGGQAEQEVQSRGMTADDVSPEAVASLATNISNLKSQMTQLHASKKQAEATAESYRSQKGSMVDSADAARKSLENTQQSQFIQNTEVVEDTVKTYANQKQSAAVGIDSAKLQLSYYTVTAPISGIVETKNIDRYGIAQQGSPAYIITNRNTMTVTFSVSEEVRNTFGIGQTILLDRNGQEFTAAITEIGDAVNAQTGLFTIKGTVNATGAELASGVTVKIKADTHHENGALLIPYDAVYYDEGEAYVYCVEDGKAVRTNVETGIFDEQTIVITSGLTKDSLVVTSWSPQLSNGVEVRAKEVNAALLETMAGYQQPVTGVVGDSVSENSVSENQTEGETTGDGGEAEAEVAE